MGGSPFLPDHNLKNSDNGRQNRMVIQSIECYALLHTRQREIVTQESWEYEHLSHIAIAGQDGEPSFTRINSGHLLDVLSHLRYGCIEIMHGFSCFFAPKPHG